MKIFSDHFAFQRYSQIRQVCRELFRLSGIQYFCYQCLDNNGYYTFLPSRPEPGYHLFQEGGYRNSWMFTNTLQLPGTGYIFWDIAKKYNAEAHDSLTQAFHNMQLSHGIDIVQSHNNCHEFYTFAADHPGIYKCSLRLLQQFVLFLNRNVTIY